MSTAALFRKCIFHILSIMLFAAIPRGILQGLALCPSVHTLQSKNARTPAVDNLLICFDDFRFSFPPEDEIAHIDDFHFFFPSEDEIAHRNIIEKRQQQQNSILSLIKILKAKEYNVTVLFQLEPITNNTLSPRTLCLSHDLPSICKDEQIHFINVDERLGEITIDGRKEQAVFIDSKAIEEQSYIFLHFLKTEIENHYDTCPLKGIENVDFIVNTMTAYHINNIVKQNKDKEVKKSAIILIAKEQHINTILHFCEEQIEKKDWTTQCLLTLCNEKWLKKERPNSDFEAVAHYTAGNLDCNILHALFPFEFKRPIGDTLILMNKSYRIGTFCNCNKR